VRKLTKSRGNRGHIGRKDWVKKGPCAVRLGQKTMGFDIRGPEISLCFKRRKKGACIRYGKRTQNAKRIGVEGRAGTILTTFQQDGGREVAEPKGREEKGGPRATNAIELQKL